MNWLKDAAAEYGIALSAEQLSKLAVYMELLLDWNTRMNLTAITERSEILSKHFLDSLILLDAWEIPERASLIDVGTGAGFPGIPLKICRPDLNLTLLDSLAKRVEFLEAVCEAASLPCAAIHGRAELLANEGAHREQYSLATARAVASLPMLCELCLGFVEVGGVFLAMKGPEIRAEVESARTAIEQMGATLIDIKEYQVSGAGFRGVAVIKKISQTPTRYPRTFKKMSKLPL